MLLRDTKLASLFALPAIASTAVLLFLLRNRQITDSSAPGSGVTIAGAELFVRVSAIFHAAVSAGADGLALLLRVASTPALLAYTALESELRFAAAAIGGVAAVLQHASVYVLHAFWVVS